MIDHQSECPEPEREVSEVMLMAMIRSSNHLASTEPEGEIIQDFEIVEPLTMPG